MIAEHSVGCEWRVLGLQGDKGVRLPRSRGIGKMCPRWTALADSNSEPSPVFKDECSLDAEHPWHKFRPGMGVGHRYGLLTGRVCVNVRFNLAKRFHNHWYATHLAMACLTERLLQGQGTTKTEQYACHETACGWPARLGKIQIARWSCVLPAGPRCLPCI